ncbi:MAG TPA: thiolase family protein [Oligoflexia bacterium]|nr:thiolase family protein [Oligoflexia bacterium]HMR24537.1 thiolase family protein [Oligoflexia bacterium]
MSARFYRDPDVVIVAAKRTPFAKIQSLYKTTSALDLAKMVSEKTIQTANLEPSMIDHCVVGSVLVSGQNHAYLPRHLSLALGFNLGCPSYLVNRLCGSGMQALVEAFMMIKVNKAKCVLAVGVESMSQAASYSFDNRVGLKLGHTNLIDSVAGILHDQWIDLPMGQTAELIAKQYNFSREQCDEYAHESHKKYKAAWDEGFYQHEMIAVEGQPVQDEFFRLPNKNDLKKLTPVFSKTGVHTAASSSGLADGASAIVLMDKYEADLKGITYHTIVKDYAVTGCDPKTMGLGPVEAIRHVLNQQQLSMRDISLFDINEAFAGQVMAVKQDLGIPKHRLNIHGGSLAMGHPLGASANRNVVTLSHALREKNKNYGIASACIGGGQGIATLLQNIS